MRWHFQKDGYVWMECKKGEEKIKVLTHFSSEDTSVEYSPFIESGLFKNFSEIELNEIGIIQFANKYGTLTTNQIETLEYWASNVKEIWIVISIWEGIIKSNKLALSRLKDWIDQQNESKINQYETHNISANSQSVSNFIQIINDTLNLNKINEEVYSTTCNLLKNHINNKLKLVSSEMYLNNKQLYLGYSPKSLLSGMWLQLALAVSEDKDFRRCKECQTWFEISPDSARKSKLFCSNACRSKNYRKRRAYAKKLFNKGYPSQKISKELNTDISTIEKWVKE